MMDSETMPSGIIRGGFRRHREGAEICGYGDAGDEFIEFTNDDYGDGEDDEERLLRRCNSSGGLLRRTAKRRRQHQEQQQQKSAQSRSERFLNRTLVAAFAIIAFVFVRDRTLPWWREQGHRAALLSRRQMRQTRIDDGRGLEYERSVDPMAVYGANDDDDSARGRDHDPLNLYGRYTGRGDGVPDVGGAREGSAGDGHDGGR